MKFKSLSIAAVSAFGISVSAFAADPVTVKGGTVNFTGELVNAACAVSTASSNQTVSLGQYRTARLAKAGDKTAPVPFSIKLSDCDPTVQKTAAIAFQGTAAEGGTNLLGLSASSANGTVAKNVGLQITDHTAKALGITGAAFSTPQALLDGENALQFNAYYVATGIATAGDANASATFTVKYE
ncbi:type 1 fimbrial major subunit FimA [Acinetobacter nematophilus]|uniref:Type 1 fimbrial major subunit FimA n=1 Tax=Acinetobacter nematophilus TaxID=2994642 RepID=A0A9X3E422_9GAMM|nr:type 1 fimbrial major subunit FimA [Acinetobacter nematophilus]MCX5469034.1 type 1 fimbrial major subunit FimA [Acinetobacter nematophilus]